MSNDGLVRYFACVGLAALWASVMVVGSCSDDDGGGGGSAVRDLCRDQCRMNSECSGGDYDFEEMNECIGSCMSYYQHSQDDCLSELMDYNACTYASVLENECSWEESYTDCEDESQSYFDCTSSSDTDVDSDVDTDYDYCEGYTGSNSCCTVENTCGWEEDSICDCDGWCEWDYVDCA